MTPWITIPIFIVTLLAIGFLSPAIIFVHEWWHKRKNK